MRMLVVWRLGVGKFNNIINKNMRQFGVAHEI